MIRYLTKLQFIKLASKFIQLCLGGVVLFKQFFVQLFLFSNLGFQRVYFSFILFSLQVGFVEPRVPLSVNCPSPHLLLLIILLGRHLLELGFSLFKSLLKVLDSNLERQELVVLGSVLSFKLLHSGFKLISACSSLIGLSSKIVKFLHTQTLSIRLVICKFEAPDAVPL